MNNRILAAAVVSLAALVAAPTAQAQVDWGARVGLVLDGTDPMIGVEAIMPLTGDFFFNPNLEHVFGDNDYTSVNADVHYDFDLRRVDRFLWIGAGAALLLADDTDFGANIFAGYGWDTGRLIPYAQAKLLLADDTQGSIAVGLRF